MPSHWLNAIPIPSLGLKIDTISLRIACVLRLGSPLCAGRFSRHSHVINLIKKALESAHVPPVLEPQVIPRTDGKWRDGITIFSWKMGNRTVWDFTCCETFAPIHLDVSHNHFENVAEQIKLAKYAQLEHDFEIVSICIETMGPWGSNGLKFVLEVGRRISVDSGKPRSTVFLMQAIGVAIQRENAVSVFGTVCKGQHLEEIYYL